MAKNVNASKLEALSHTLGEGTLYNPVIVKAAEYKGKVRLDVRHYWKAQDGLAPTQKGVSLPIEMVDELIDALVTLRDKLAEV